MNRVYTIVLIIFISSPAFAQYTKLHDFGAPSPQGTRPYASTVTDGTNLYGSTSSGGANDHGTIYKIDQSGNITVLHDVESTAGPIYSSFLLDGTTLYGTSVSGGAKSRGFIFKINTDGSGYTDIFDFDGNNDGMLPYGGLISDGTSLYGMSNQGGTGLAGTVYKLNKDGSGFKVLYSFSSSGPDKINGGYPNGSLTLDAVNNILFGMTAAGGASDRGVIFKMNTDGTGFTKILDFNGPGNGRTPLGSVYYDGTFLWGMTPYGGAGDYGTLFRILPDGTGYTKFADFAGGSGAGDKGVIPLGNLVPDATNTYLYGVTSLQGSGFGGTLFRIKFDGSGFSSIATLKDGPFGTYNTGTLTLVGNTFYLARPDGGTGTSGAIYKMDISGNNLDYLYSFYHEGSQPTGDLVSDGTYLYGVNSSAGRFSSGSIYRIKYDGTGFENIADFNPNITGQSPNGGLLYNASKLYGMNGAGGGNNKGVVYSLNADGTNFKSILDFNGAANGASARGALITDGSFLYGMTQEGGANNVGVVFKVKFDGTGYVKLHDFETPAGSNPDGSLILDGGVLYGMTHNGGTTNSGTIFKINTDGSNFSVIYNFDTGSGDGAGEPEGSLYSDGTYLYGMTLDGGVSFGGIAFRIKKDGTGFQNIQDLGPIGGRPYGSFVSDGTWLYAFSPNTIFKVKPDGSGGRLMMNFPDVADVYGTPYLKAGFLYGVGSYGGNYNNGAIFKRSIAPAPTIDEIDQTLGPEGLYVRISGNEFDPDPKNDIVKFNGKTAQVVNVDAYSILTLVPKGATTGPISITSQGATVTSAQDFQVTQQAWLTTDSIKTCNIKLTAAGYGGSVNGDYNRQLTFVPDQPNAKINIVFPKIQTDELLVIFNGPDESYGALDSISSNVSNRSYTSTAPNGQLTIRYVWGDSFTTYDDATVSCVVQPGVLTITAEPTDEDACVGREGSFHVTATGPAKITYQWQVSGNNDNFDDIKDDATYSGANTATLTVATPDDANSGLYYKCLVGGGANGLVLATNSVTLTVNPTPKAPTVSSVPDATCIGTSATITAAGAKDGQYRWYSQPTGGQEITDQINAKFTTPLLTNTTTYYVAITDNTCESDRTAAIVTVQPCGIVVYNAVSPNNDGKNDALIFEYMDLIPNKMHNVVKIYNRWGEEVFEMINYNNHDKVFTGSNKNGNKLPSGTYYYKVKFTDKDGGDDLTGFLELKY